MSCLKCEIGGIPQRLAAISILFKQSYACKLNQFIKNMGAVTIHIHTRAVV